MKALKVVFGSFLAIFAVVYLAFLFVLPYCVDLNQYSPQLTKIIQDTTGYQIDIKGLKIKTAWNLDAGALIDKADLYQDGEKFAQINHLEVDVSLLPLLFGKEQINKVSADKIMANISEKMLNGKASNSKPLNFSAKMPSINAKKYRISFLDGRNDYTLKGENLKISDFILGKKIKVKTSGKLILNKREQITYNVNVLSRALSSEKSGQADIMKVFADLYKYNVNANINANLKVKNSKDDTDVDGSVDVDKIFFTFAGKTYPPSNLKLDFKGDKAKINAALHVDNSAKAIITGFFKTGKNRYVDLHVASDKLKINDVLLIAKATSKTLGLKKLEGFDATGFVKANFNVKSNFKKVESDGYLKIENAAVKNKLYNVSLNSLNADVDFSQDAVKIVSASANLNSQPIKIKGLIDKGANADISVLADNLELKGALLAMGKSKILKENDINRGTVDIKATLKGQLNKAFPKLDILVSNVRLKNKHSGSVITASKAVILSQENKGKAQISALKVINSANAIISAPKITADFNQKDVNIDKTQIHLNNIPLDLWGKISNIDSQPKLNTVNISLPHQISVPIQGYPNSKMFVKGNLIASGDLDNPQIKGEMDIPLINMPTVATTLKNITLHFDKNIKLTCPYLQVADSTASFDAQINKDFSKGIVAQNVNFVSENIDLNAITAALKSSSNNQALNLIITNGKSSVNHFKTAGINASNIISNISFKNNILYLDKLWAEAYNGKIGGNVNYDFNRKKTHLGLQGRGLSANPALTAMLSRNDDINGKLDFDSDISMSGFGKNEIIKSLNGNVKFIVSNGKMGTLGKFEHLIYAQNIVSNNVFKTSLNLILKAVTAKNTGVYKYMRGKIAFANGWANIMSVKMSGPTMSIYMTGRYYMPANTANLIMLGRISDEVVNRLGVVGEFSVNKAVSYIPKIGEISEAFRSQYTTNPYYEDTSNIPPLTPQTEFPTKEFKVVIDGDVQKQSSVKTFKWLVTPKVSPSPAPQPIQEKKPQAQVPDFVKNLPDFKN